jgi:hypothetical protein
MTDPIAEAADLLRYEHATKVEVEDLTIVVVEPVKGDPGLTVLRVLGLAQAAPLVGAAAHGPNGVAVGVWRGPELYLARWTRGKRWVVGYRITGGSRLRDYVGIEGRVPTRLETGHWYDTVPEEINELFLEAGLLVDDPPFPVEKPPPSPAAGAGRSTTPTAIPRPGARPRAKPPQAPARSGRLAAQAAPLSRAKGAPATRVCAECRMRKAVGQFVPGSDLCVDCRAG